MFATTITSGPSPFSLSCPFTPRDPEANPHSRRDSYRDWPFTSPLTSPPSGVSPSFVIPLEKTLNLSTVSVELDLEAVDGTSSSTSNASLIGGSLGRSTEVEGLTCESEVLEEVEEERQKQGMLREEVWAEGEDTNNGIVLVACKDERSCLQLEEFITNGPKKVMHEEWKKYLLNKVQLRDIVHKKKKPKDPKPKYFGILDGVTPITPAQNSETTKALREHDALVAAASKLKNPAENVHVVKDTPQAEFGEQGRAKRKRKLGTRNGPDVLDSSGVRNNDKEETSDEIRMSDSENKIVEDVTNPVSAGRFCETMQDRISVENIVLRRHTNPDAAASNGKPLPLVHFYALESDQPILDILKPSRSHCLPSRHDLC
ncbi:LOW QUALITY PROTEIN: hypothetical protein Fmac_011389 [Flemingia macrophylla]|uniref:Uncharacterized protein n=1 Tax=Flemingia macrophylla TaxID=520843 RepID=A0ABD1MMA9_9FABA